MWGALGSFYPSKNITWYGQDVISLCLLPTVGLGGEGRGLFKEQKNNQKALQLRLHPASRYHALKLGTSRRRLPVRRLEGWLIQHQAQPPLSCDCWNTDPHSSALTLLTQLHVRRSRDKQAGRLMLRTRFGKDKTNRRVERILTITLIFF